MWPFRKKGLVAKAIYIIYPDGGWETPAKKDVVKFLKSILEADRVSNLTDSGGITVYLSEDTDSYLSEIRTAIYNTFKSVDFELFDNGLWVFDSENDGLWRNINRLGWCFNCNRVRSFYFNLQLDGVDDDIYCRSCKTSASSSDKKVAFTCPEKSNEEILKNAETQQKLAAKAAQAG